jgi:hypothetical protein
LHGKDCDGDAGLESSPGLAFLGARLTALRAPERSATVKHTETIRIGPRTSVSSSLEARMAVSITATITPGQGTAAANHRVLIPRIAARFPEVAKSCEFGTINVRLDKPLDRSRADFWTPPIPWIPAQMPDAEQVLRLEAFGFIRITFECPLAGPNYAAWIMLPEGSNLTYCEDSAEVIASEFIPGVAYGGRCAVHIDHDLVLPAPSWFGKNCGRSLTQLT